MSVLDDTGKLLSQSPDGGAGNGVDAQQLQYVQQIEQQYTRRIMDILEPVVGRDNVKAQVTAELDFSQTESTSSNTAPIRRRRPPQSAASRYLKTTETASSQTAGWRGGGQPAASTIGRPINGANPAPTAAGQQGARRAPPNANPPPTTRWTRPCAWCNGNNWAVKRLSAAVVVNYQSSEEKGKTVTKALTPEQVEQMTALVRETIGFNKDRGDSVNLMNAQFRMDTPPVDNTPLWKQPETIELARSFAWPVGMSLFAALVLLGLVRPALKTLANRAPFRWRAPSSTRWRPRHRSARRCRHLPGWRARPGNAGTAAVGGCACAGAPEPMAVARIVKNWVSGDIGG